MACTFIKNDQGEIIDVRSETGAPSQLYKQALDKYQDKQKAIDIVATTLSEGFIETGVSPSLEQVEAYIVRENSNTLPLSAKQLQDLKNTVMGNIVSVEELYRKLQSAFYVGNLFAPTEQSLRNSGLYSPYELQAIINDIDLQQRIKNSIEALNNTEIEDSQLENYFDLTTIKSNEINSFGKLNNYNPYIVEKDTIDLLGGLTTQSDFYEQIENLPYPTEVTFEEMQQYVRAQEMDDNLQPLRDNTQTLLEIKSAETSSEVIDNIETLLSVNDAVIEQNADKVRAVLSTVEKQLAQEGLDVIGIKDRALDIELKPFLQGLLTYLKNPTLANTTAFSQTYNSFFQIDISNKYRPLKLPKNRNYVYTEAIRSEMEMFENNLVKAQPNVFIKIRRQSLEDMYDIVQSYREGTIEDLQREVQQQMGQAQELMTEEVVLWKMYLNVPLNITQEVTAPEQLENNTLFEGNQQYLENEFPTDFYKEMLKQKINNSPQYQNFYSHFTINQKGIQLINQDPITLDTIQTWIEEIKPTIANNLKQYSLISKQLPRLISAETEITAKESQRALAVNYPLQIPKLNAQSFRVGEENVIAKNTTQEFIRIGTETYENTATIADLTLYTKLPVNDSVYNRYGIKQPSSDISLQEYAHLESRGEIKFKSYLNQKERTNINQENFNCL